MILFRDNLFELANLQLTELGFPKHSHPEYVISLNLSGQETVWLDGKVFEVGTAVTLYNPGQVQSCTVRAEGNTWSSLSLYVAPTAFEKLLGVPVEFQRPLSDDAGLERMLRGLAEAKTPALVEERLVLLAGRLARGAGGATTERAVARKDARLARVASLLREDLTRMPPLAELAREAGMTVEHLVRSFGKATGLPPRAWQLQERITESRRRLHRGDDILDVALDLGFADQAHFHKLFRKLTGMTPGAYRARHIQR